MKPMVVDLYHGDELDGEPVAAFRRLKAAGIVGVIHKATQGVLTHDAKYAERRAAAKVAGLLWGAYDFNTGDPVEQQVDYFLSIAQPDDDTLLALDFEDNKHSQMSLEQCRAYLAYAEKKVGRKFVLYSGNRAKDLLGAKVDPFLGAHRLWLSQYGPTARLQSSWKSWWLWQFTGDGVGPGPHELPGIKTKGIDINTYAGSAEQLAAEWSGKPSAPIVVVPPIPDKTPEPSAVAAPQPAGAVMPQPQPAPATPWWAQLIVALAQTFLKPR